MLVGRYGAVLDANILYSATLRGALLRMAQERLFRPMWSQRILEEWERSVRETHPHLKDEQFERMHAIFRLFPDAEVTGQQHLGLANPLPDPDDEHVFATAVAGAADAIVTFNTKDFPADVAADLGIEIRHPDQFLVNIIDLDPARALKALRVQREALKSPPMDAETFLNHLLRAGLVQTHLRLTGLVGLL